MRKHWFATLLLAGLLVPGNAQVITPASKFILNVDFARFMNDDTTGYVELYYLFYPGLVSVAQTGDGGYRGKIFLRISGTQKETGTAYVNELRSLPVVVSDTSQLLSSNTVVSLSGYVLPFGTYEFSVVATDSIVPGRSDSLSFTFPMTDVAGATMISDLELCSRVQQAAGPGSFVKNTLEVVPNATLMFGISNHPVVFHYAELYNLTTDQPYVLRSTIFDASGEAVKSTSRTRQYSVTNAVDVGTMNVSSLPSGRYMYELGVMADSVTEIARSRKMFFIYNPHIKTETVSGASLKASELAGMDYDELGEEFAAAAYLANGSEVDAFGKLTTTDARREWLAQFWASVEQGKGGREPILRTDYMRRVQASNTRYRTHGRSGWKSDRGRVFVLYGEPDEIERVPSAEDVKPYEIWYYYRIENGVQFIFVDRTGFGEYILVHSTKRGEMQDDAWSRLLQ